MKYLILLLTLTFSISWAQDADSISLEEQLRLLGEGDLLIAEEKSQRRTVNKSEQTDSPTTTPDDSTSVQSELATADSAAISDTTFAETSEEDTSVLEEDDAVLEEELILVEEDDTTTINDSGVAVVAVESIEAINVGETQEGYKSPRRAMLLSLALPGAGQAYTKQYWRTGMYAAIEIGLIVGGIKHKRTSDELLQNAHDYLDTSYSSDTLKAFLEELYAYGLEEYNSTDLVDGYMFNNNSSFVTDTNGSTSIEKYIEYIESNRYSLAHTDIFSAQGWKDAKPDDYGLEYDEFYNRNTLQPGITIDSINILQLIGAATPYGTATRRDTYASMLESSDKRAQWSTLLFISIGINHAVSAIDAYISAHRYNKKLLKGNGKEDLLPDSEESPEEKEIEVEEVDIFSRLSIENEFYPNQSGSFTTGVSISWRF